VLCKLLAPIRRQGFGSPRTTRNDFEATGIDMLNALPDHR
jgi:hypothetical protein